MMDPPPHPISSPVVFFLQAEDGIRDLTVTGVQTCVLPISGRPSDTTTRNRTTPSAELLPEYERAVKLEEGVVRFLVVVSEGLPAKPEAAPAVIAADVVVDEIEEDEA